MTSNQISAQIASETRRHNLEAEKLQEEYQREVERQNKRDTILKLAQVNSQNISNLNASLQQMSDNYWKRQQLDIAQYNENRNQELKRSTLELQAMKQNADALYQAGELNIGKSKVELDKWFKQQSLDLEASEQEIQRDRNRLQDEYNKEINSIRRDELNSLNLFRSNEMEYKWADLSNSMKYSSGMLQQGWERLSQSAWQNQFAYQRYNDFEYALGKSSAFSAKLNNFKSMWDIGGMVNPFSPTNIKKDFEAVNSMLKTLIPLF